MSNRGPTQQYSITDTQLKSLSKNNNIPGISVATISSNGYIEVTSVGVANNSTDQKVTDQTVFEAASLSKPVFAYIVLKMAEWGEIDLDVPLHEQSKSGFGPPPLRNTKEYEKITPRMILSHQAGLPNWFKQGEPEKYEEQPGTAFNYSGVAYCFLNEVVQERSGKSLEKLAQSEFAQIGMTSSSFFQPEDGTRASANLAVGHNAEGKPDERSHSPKQSEQRPDGTPFQANPAASLYTTAEDFSRFLKACVEDEFIRKNMFFPNIQLSGNDQKGIKAGVSDEQLQHISWGLGMGLQQCDDGSTIAFHWGDCDTVRNFAALKFDQTGAYQNGVVCLTNSANGPKVFRQICEPIVGDLTPVSQWLSIREQLPMQPIPHVQIDQTQRRKPLTTLREIHDPLRQANTDQRLDKGTRRQNSMDRPKLK